LLATSIGSGRLFTTLGKYRLFPIPGTFVACAAMLLLATLTLDTPLRAMYLYMALLGGGLGQVMPVIVLAVQNTVEFRH
ncbi:EmrB/QacA family drug resistance transporter, partial [Burkholderia pseudomallei]